MMSQTLKGLVVETSYDAFVLKSSHLVRVNFTRCRSPGRELNALEVVDYENVLKLKLMYLKHAFHIQKESFLASAKFKQVCAVWAVTSLRRIYTQTVYALYTFQHMA